MRGRGKRGGLAITLTDSVYVSVGAVEADRLDKVTDWPVEIYVQRVTVNIHLVFLWTRLTFARLCLRDCDLAAPQGALNLIKGIETFTFTKHLETEGKK